MKRPLNLNRRSRLGPRKGPNFRLPERVATKTTTNRPKKRNRLTPKMHPLILTAMNPPQTRTTKSPLTLTTRPRLTRKRESRTHAGPSGRPNVVKTRMRRAILTSAGALAAVTTKKKVTSILEVMRTMRMVTLTSAKALAGVMTTKEVASTPEGMTKMRTMASTLEETTNMKTIILTSEATTKMRTVTLTPEGMKVKTVTLILAAGLEVITTMKTVASISEGATMMETTTLTSAAVFAVVMKKKVTLSLGVALATGRMRETPLVSLVSGTVVRMRRATSPALASQVSERERMTSHFSSLGLVVERTMKARSSLVSPRTRPKMETHPRRVCHILLTAVLKTAAYIYGLTEAEETVEEPESGMF